ncbi:hypothetical protein [Gorillibacterium massiliense]|uniref:hypothetical protein n=1 Tax=Gorillibacterium massiliense TaxID=1280390 RepID=UPI0004AD68DA|nr:hypothetical protein [Gorillibacterium massiliense]
MKKLDELQMLKRGNVFKHGLFLMGGLTLLNACLENNDIFILPDKWSALFIVLVTIAVCGIEMIIYEIYPLLEKRQKRLIYFIGLFGAASIIVSAIDMVNEHTPFIRNRQVTDTGTGILFGCAFLSIAAAYLTKSKYQERHNEDD